MTLPSKGTTLPSPNPMTLLRAGAATLLALAVCAVHAPVTSAGIYHHFSLGAYDYKNADGWSANTTDHGGGWMGAVLSATGATGTWNALGGRSAFQSGETTQFTYNAPPNTTLATVFFLTRLGGFASGDWSTVGWNNGNQFHLISPSTNTTNYFGYSDLSGTSLTIQQQCLGPSNSCTASQNATFELYSTDVGLSDVVPPTAGSASGSLVSDAKLAGTEALAVPVSDAGSGVYKLRVYDGSTLIASPTIDTNSGHCYDVNNQHYFDRRVPCLLSATAEASIDTTPLADGTHTFKAYVEDAAGNTTLALSPTSQLVANHPPVNNIVPTIPAGDLAKLSAPLVGQTLTFPDGGSWSGPSLTYAYAWLQCDASGTGCVQIPNATGLSYTPAPEDIGHRLKLAVTATNVAGSVTAYSTLSGQVTAPKTADPVTDKPSNGTNGKDGNNGANGTNGNNGSSSSTTNTVVPPNLPVSSIASSVSHTFIGRIAGEPAGATCPGEKASLKFEHVTGGQVRLGYGKASTAQLLLTCTTTGKAIADAKLDIATKTGQAAAVASDVTTDGAGHAIIRLAKGASRGITVGYRMFADDIMARATATLKVLVTGKVNLKANHHTLHNGRAVTLRGSLAGGRIPKRGVTLAVQWKDGKRWRPFAQIKTNKKGQFTYAYKFTRTRRTVRYQLRVQVTKGQVDYPYQAASSKPVKVTVAP
jgi:hypothetical protein